MLASGSPVPARATGLESEWEEDAEIEKYERTRSRPSEVAPGIGLHGQIVAVADLTQKTVVL